MEYLSFNSYQKMKIFNWSSDAEYQYQIWEEDMCIRCSNSSCESADLKVYVQESRHKWPQMKHTLIIHMT